MSLTIVIMKAVKSLFLTGMEAINMLQAGADERKGVIFREV